jgi:two-component system, NarL family, nitrate/nitrite response regulator NarL
MTAAALVNLPLRLRVAIAAADPAMALALRELVASSGHLPVGLTAPADAVLTDGSVASAQSLPIIALGSEEADFAGLLADDASPAQVDAALRAVAVGLQVRTRSPQEPGFAALPAEPAPALTPREVEVLTALADGLANKAVARRLGISPHTVKFHIESLFRKLGAVTRAEAVAKGLRRQIVEF